MTMQDADLTVRHAVTVAVPQDRAFEVFTGRLTDWWPLETHHIGATTPVEEIIEPQVGGRWFERAADGTECDHGHVLAWEPPARIVLSWSINADWAYDTTVVSEVEVRFVAEGPSSTRVELEHRKLDVFGARAEEMRSVFSSESGWPGLLKAYAGSV